MKKLYIISLFTLSSFLTGCYTQLATRDYEREDFGMEQESTVDSAAYYDSLFAESDTVYYDTVYVDEDAEIYDGLYADYPVGESVVYPEIIYVGGGYYRPYWSYWYYPWDYYYPAGCLVPGYWPAWYPGYCGIGFYYNDYYYNPYHYGGYYGYATGDPKYKYRTNSTHNSRLRDNDGGRSTTRTRDGIRTGGYVGRTASVNNGGSSTGRSGAVDVDNEIGKSRGSSGSNWNVNEALPVSKSGSSRTLVASGNRGSNEVKDVRQVKNQDKKTSIKNKSYEGTRRKVIIKTRSGSSTSTRSDTKIYKPDKNTSSSSRSAGRVYKPSSRTSRSSESYRSNSSRSSTKSYSSPSRSGSSGSKSYSSPSRSSSSRSSYTPRSGSSSRSSAASSSSSRSGGSRSSGRSSGKSRR